MNKTSTLSLAAAAAMLALSSGAILSSASAAGMADETVHCYGVNSCKGTSDCKTASNECKGQNSCKGQGFKEMTEAKCTQAGGSLTPPAAVMPHPK